MKELFRNLLKLQELQFDGAGDSTAEAAIAQLRKKIPLPILEHYDRLAVRGKKGVAIVRNQVCTGCHMRIPIGAINTLMHGEDIQMCETCGRYLYLPPETPVQPVEAAAPASAPAPAAVKPVKAKSKRAKTAAKKNQTE
jgi:predicted  nucleic acid-binding Zn-ribbon protein